MTWRFHAVYTPPGGRTGRFAGAQFHRRRGVCITDRPNDPNNGSCHGSWKRPWGLTTESIRAAGRRSRCHAAGFSCCSYPARSRSRRVLGSRARGRDRLGPEQLRLADRHSARRRDRCCLPLPEHLAAHKAGNPLTVLAEGYQSAFLACAVLAGIGLALAFLLPGRPRMPAHELPEPDPATYAAAARDVVIRSGTK